MGFELVILLLEMVLFGLVITGRDNEYPFITLAVMASIVGFITGALSA